jgi:hypothetical protein
MANKEQIMTKNELLVASIGRKLMDISEKMPMKGLSDAEIGRTNRMSSFGDALTRFRTAFGPQNLEDVLKLTGVSEQEAEEFMQIGYSK